MSVRVRASREPAYSGFFRYRYQIQIDNGTWGDKLAEGHAYRALSDLGVPEDEQVDLLARAEAKAEIVSMDNG